MRLRFVSVAPGGVFVVNWHSMSWGSLSLDKAGRAVCIPEGRLHSRAHPQHAVAFPLAYSHRGLVALPLGAGECHKGDNDRMEVPCQATLGAWNPYTWHLPGGL
jgi:hypothetical protein